MRAASIRDRRRAVGGVERTDPVDHRAADAQAVDRAGPAEQEVGVKRTRRPFVCARDRTGDAGAVDSAKVARPRTMSAAGVPASASRSGERARQQHVIGVRSTIAGRGFPQSRDCALIDGGAGSGDHPHAGLRGDRHGVVARAAVDENRLVVRILGGETR